MTVRKFSPMFVVFVLAFTAAAVFAATSATISFDAGYDADEPAYPIAGSGLVSEDTCYFGESETEGPGDVVTMLMTDANGLITDIDTFCLEVATGLGVNWTDWWSYEGASDYPTLGPITYSLYDTSPDDPCYEGNENSVACADYLASGAVRCIAEDYFQPASLPAGAPFPVCNPGAGSAGCTLNIPSGSVVGEAPLGAQAYYSPGNAAPGVVLNPGTYIVVGQDESETYYKIVLACRFLWVRKDTMQPSYLPPQNGTPLPTRIVS